MSKIGVKYLGLDLTSPIIVASCGLTKSIDKIKEFESNGAGAIVLKSLFEEEIRNEISKLIKYSGQFPYPETEDYVREYVSEKSTQDYLELITKAKKSVNIPIIASINCVTSQEWTSYAKEIEQAGADALELNIFILPTSKNQTNEEIENIYVKIVTSVAKLVKIPIAVKITQHLTNPIHTAYSMELSGAKGIVMFNRMYKPNIDIKNLILTAGDIFSSPAELQEVIRWVALTYGNIKADICATTGIQNGEGAIKAMLAGANAVAISSILYKKGAKVIKEINETIDSWMQEKNFQNTKDFIGKLSYKNIQNPAAFERVQFMKFFSGIE
ncbi:MAG: dihydroorotate dehydrogenase-like protein [Bacteroidales bacterium]|jgi:dihydroorotate dehydrogenase (fumarate)|nr:dihydroorotate dehydrogenase-like protein [Bacteroidales bacterium]